MKTYTSVIIGAFLFSLPFIASAHAVVSPSQSATAKYETFSLSVPVEKDVPTVAIRILMPEGVDRVTPVVKPGWKITIVKDGDRVTEILWTDGSIPAGQKDFFQFTARTPAEDATLAWKAYQTYRGGEVVAWDQAPGAEAHGESASHPYSTTDVQLAPEKSGTTSQNLPYLISIAALALSGVALIRSSRRT